MAQKNYPRNLMEYAESVPNKNKFYLEIKDKTGVSMSTAERWCRFYYTAKEPSHLEALSKLTGIAKEDLFKKFGNEN